ncbi:hypothetical protein HDV00_010518 [Rhizophlyctis rosea]|nr:hypothetical protein HDV00_010518 [Rhizophlyctis rosea]
MVRPGRANQNPVPGSFLPTLTEARDDLLLLSSDAPVSEDDITQNLLARLAKDQSYTYCSPRVLVALPPRRQLDSTAAAQLSKEYAESVRGASADGKQQELGVHLFDFVSSAYLHMRARGVDQSIILRNGTSAHPTTHLIPRHLTTLSKPNISSKKSKLHSAILKLPSVLSAFGNAVTPFDKDAKCFTSYMEYQFANDGRMVGVKVIDYLLEKGRVAGLEDGGRSFHIFYYLLAGATHDEKLHLHLSDHAHFHYLNSHSSKLPVITVDPHHQTNLDTIRESLKALGIGRRQQAQLWQILAAILHLGNVTFQDAPNNSQEACSVRNYAQLELVAELLGVHPASVEGVLTYRAKKVGRDFVSTFLDAEAASQQRDAFARSLYSVLFSWIIEQINNKVCQEDDASWSNFIAVLDVPAFTGRDTQGQDFYRLLVNYENERVHALMCDRVFAAGRSALLGDGVEVANVGIGSNREVLDVLSSARSGVLPVMEKEIARGSKDTRIAEKIVAANSDSAAFVASASSRSKMSAFGIHHYAGVVEYSTHGFSQHASDILQSDFVSLIRGNPEHPGTVNPFLRGMFSDKLVATQTSKADGSTLVAARSLSRNPSLKRRKSKKGENGGEDDDVNLDPAETLSHQFRTSIGELFETLTETQTWFVAHLQSSHETGGKVDPALIRRQVTDYELPALAANAAGWYTESFGHDEFIRRFSPVLGDKSYGDAKTQCTNICYGRGWTTKDAVVGKSRIHLSEKVWRGLEEQLRVTQGTLLVSESASMMGKMSTDSARPHGRWDYTSGGDDSASAYDDGASHYESEFEATPPTRVEHVGALTGDVPLRDLESGSGARGTSKDEKGPSHHIIEAKVEPVKPKKKMTGSRCRWLTCTWFTTWWIPFFFLSWCGKMKQRDRQMAWREKFTLCVIILLMNGCILFFIIGIGQILCPRKPQLSPGEISSLNHVGNKATVFMYGNYYVIPSSLIQWHKDQGYGFNSDDFWQDSVLGKDVSQMFRKDGSSWDKYCNGVTGSNTRKAFSQPATYNLFPNPSDGFAVNPAIWSPHGPPYKAEDFLDQVKGYIKGQVVWDVATIVDRQTKYSQKFILAYDNLYEVTSFYYGVYGQTNSNFLGTYTKSLFDKYSLLAGTDATSDFEALKRQRPQEWVDVMTCMQGMLYVGKIDHRNDLKCTVSNYILMVASCILVAVIGFKFLAALQFGGKRIPEEHDKFVICQVPCYTEGENSLLRTLESLALLDYDDKHKLLFVICDGMIIGSGNDRPTPRIVLDILGVDPSVDPEAVAFQSLGEGNKQLNFGKVYSGLYEIQGRVVPFVVVVKVGKPSERQRPGNRGKRDSQLVLMRFLSRVHFNQAMCPLELELYHQMKNVIGVDPSFYEYIFMVDADTEVYPDSLNRLVSTMTRDAKIAGICGETQISNEKDSWVAMIQVYEYFISHHLAKAFESLFGSVTCLPGCFCMYRVRTPTKNVPLLVAPSVVRDYSENDVDTLHLKNLLHLGEDRYLTTLMMKHFPSMKTTFISDAKCKTNAPDKWNVLLSQRRRWINSTVHNLLELLFLNEMCGFCCFSMRFVVFIDLFATFVQPAALGYIIYLVYSVVTGASSQFPLISIIMLGAVYGFQVIIFLLKREWQHIGWMIIYMLAIPIFGCYIPMYSFWHFDDFSWGNTRQVTEEGGKKKEVPVAEEPFDPASVPLVKWSDFESGRIAKDHLDESRSVSSYHSHNTGFAGGVKGSGPLSAYAPSAYGGSTYGAYPPAPSSYGGFDTGAYGVPAYDPPYNQQRNSWGTQYTDAAAPPTHSAAHQQLQRSNSMNSRYTASTDSAPRALPSDEEILKEVRELLARADLMTVTKKSVREELGRRFGVDLSAKREWIHRCIDGVLKGEL